MHLELLERKRRITKLVGHRGNYCIQTGMAEEFDLEALNQILANEILERIGINVVDISYVYQQEEEQVLVEQQSETENVDHNSFEYLLQKENKAWEIAREQEEKIKNIRYKD
jgi:hypothetical protein